MSAETSGLWGTSVEGKGYSPTSLRTPEDSTIGPALTSRKNVRLSVLTSRGTPTVLRALLQSELSESSGPGKPAVNQDDRDTFSLQHICLGQRELRGVSSCGQSALILCHGERGCWCVALHIANVTNHPGNVASADTRLEKHTLAMSALGDGSVSSLRHSALCKPFSASQTKPTEPGKVTMRVNVPHFPVILTQCAQLARGTQGNGERWP